MDEIEARSILEQELQAYKTRSYSELVELIGRTGTDRRRAPSGTVYQVEVQVFWDVAPGWDLRVGGCIDDGSARYTRSPLCNDFIMAPDGSFVGE